MANHREKPQSKPSQNSILAVSSHSERRNRSVPNSPDFKSIESCLLLKRLEENTASLADGVHAAVDAHSVQLLETSTVELQHLEARSDVPDVAEGDVGELTAPLGSDADSTEEGHQHVAEVLAAVEAFVRVAPHAVHRVEVLGLGEDVLE